MYTKEQEETALAEFALTGSVYRVILRLGYPDKAIAQLPSNEHPIIHSERGCHYRWPEWICKTKQAGITRSMSRKGCSPDNSACEGFFGRLKNEMFYGRQWVGVSIEELIDLLHRYIIWYNEERIKISLGAMSPIQYRRKPWIDWLTVQDSVRTPGR